MDFLQVSNASVSTIMSWLLTSGPVRAGTDAQELRNGHSLWLLREPQGRETNRLRGSVIVRGKEK